MVRIGEKLNSSIPAARKLMEERDAGGLAALARRQLDGGADLLDVNAAVFLRDEADVLAWAIGAVQAATGARVMVDSTNPEAVRAALVADRVGGAVVNSVTADCARLDAIAPLLQTHGASVVALCMDESGIPPTAEGRLAAATLAVDGFIARGVPRERVWLDPLVEALAANPGAGAVTLETIRLIRRRWPDITVVCGLSNVSFGLPRRKAVNAAFLSAAVAAGLDAAILDPCDEELSLTAAAAWAVAGRDEYCMEYIRVCREKDNNQASL